MNQKSRLRPLHGLALFAGSLVVFAFACGSPESTSKPAVSASPSAASASSSAPAAVAKVPGGAREGSSVAISPDGEVVVVANEDHRSLAVIPLPIGDDAKALRVETPGRPAQIAAIGDRLFVTVREIEDGNGALVVYDRKDKTALSEIGRVVLPPDAWGIAVSPDGARAIVTSAWAAKVSLVDLEKLSVVWTREVAREPRGAMFLASGETVYISHLIDAPLTRIDAVNGDATVTRVELPASPLKSSPGEKLSASLGYAITKNPTETRLFAPRHAIGVWGPNEWFGAPAVDVLDIPTAKPAGTARRDTQQANFVEALSPFNPELKVPPWWASASPVLIQGNAAFSAPRAVVYRKSRGTLLVASEGSNEVAELDASMSDPTLGHLRNYRLVTETDPVLGVPLHGGAPSGLALSADESLVYVHCRSTDELAVQVLPPDDAAYAMAPPRFVKLAEDASERDFVMGRRLFFDSTDTTVSGGLACAGCHPEGRDDGYIWHEVEVVEGKSKFVNFFGSASGAKHMFEVWKELKLEPTNVEGFAVGFPRQTPMLAGRVKAKGPYGWKAESPDLRARIAAGFGLHRWRWGEDEKSTRVVLRSGPLQAFVREGLVPPPATKRALTPEETRGKEVFLSAATECASCHAPESDYTNRSVASFGDTPARQAFMVERNAAFKTPSLLFIGGTAPYFHDGRYATLEELIEKNGNLMGKTAHLTPEEKKALVAFLKTL